MKNKKIVVTGGLGFIGSHIVDTLVNDNEIVIIDNKSTGKIENLDNPNHENLKIAIGDLNDLDLHKIIENTDYVFHLAAAASVPMSVEDPLYYNKNNIDGTVKLLIACKDCDVKKFVFSSSSAVYGENPNMPLKETEIPLPTSPYAANKASGELYCQAFTNSYGLETVSLRYFNVFGPRQDVNSQYAAVIPNFIHALINNQEPEIFGDGEQSRDFIYVKDIVKANIAACESDYCGVVNVASGKAITINQLFDIVNNVLKSDLKPTYLDERPGDIKHSSADIKNMDKIGFKPNPDHFVQQLEKTVKWFKKVNS